MVFNGFLDEREFESVHIGLSMIKSYQRTIWRA